MNTFTRQFPPMETLTPADAAAVAEVVRAASERATAVYPVGGGTMLDIGLKPSRPGVRLSLAAMNRTIDYPADDLTVTVEAGVTIGELSRRLVEKRQRLPVDVPWPDRATVGGAVAANAAGPRRYAYGTMRDYLLGFTAVDGAGILFSGGGRVVKNAAGYNMPRLMTGSWGTLGVLTQATLMVRPLPETSAALACDIPQFELAETLLNDLTRSQVRPVAVEFVAGQPPKDGLPSGIPHEGCVGRLYVGFEGASDDVTWMLDRLKDEWAGFGATSPVSLSGAEADGVWRWMSERPAEVQIDVLPGRMVALVKEILRRAPGTFVTTHAGNGVVRVEGDGTQASLNNLLEMRAAAEAAGGRMTVLRPAIDDSLSREDVFGPPRPEFRVQRAIKERFDPKNILNPGRFWFD